jgi:cobalt-zinc-cadmium efflux system outer membrane protein
MFGFQLSARAARVFVIGTAWAASAGTARADASVSSDAQLAGPVDRSAIVRAAVARNPAVKAAEQRARAVGLSARTEGRLPPPEVMGQVWQVPLSKPYALNAQMIMIGVHQSFPAPGSLDARQEARQREAEAEEAMVGDRARQIARDADHAFVDYVEATAKHRIHGEHLEVARHVLDVAQARHGAGGPLTDVTQAEVEMARVEADVITDATLVRSARVRINALLAREPESALGPPVEGEPALPVWTTQTLLTKAREVRPELRAAVAEREAKRLGARAANREATWPSFKVGAFYFVPTDSAPQHGYGFDAAVTLPWLWGAADSRSVAEEQYAVAASTNVEAARIPIDAEVVTAESNAQSAGYRLQVMRDRVLPATKRAFDVARDGYESGRTDELTILAAARAVVDVEHDIVMARGRLDHALADLDAAVGVHVPLAPLGAFAAAHGDDHAR